MFLVMKYLHLDHGYILGRKPDSDPDSNGHKFKKIARVENHNIFSAQK